MRAVPVRRRWRAISAVLSAVLVAAALVACAPGAPAAQSTDSVAITLAKYGIATVPFAGGKAMHPVSGPTVLVLTDWQLRAVAASSPAPKAAKGAKSAPRFVPGVPLSGMDAGAAAAGSAPAGAAPDPAAAITPSALILTWWSRITTKRAKLARAAYEPPTSAKGIVPLYVLTLFLADSFDAFGRTRADSTATGSVGESGPLALGAEPFGGAPDPCGVVAGAIDDVNQFLDAQGSIGYWLKGAVGLISDAVETALGPFLKALKIALEVANVVLNAASLLQTWAIHLSVTPASGFSVAYDGNPGIGGTVTAKLDAALGELPDGVSSCLALAGLTDPTKLTGSAVDWTGGFEGAQIGVSPSMIVAPDHPTKVLDNHNQATYTFTTGTQTLDTDKPTPAFEDVWVDVHVKRADISKLNAWITSLSTGDPTGILQGALSNVAIELSFFVGDPYGLIDLIVQYWVPQDEPKVPDNPTLEIPPIGTCLAPKIVEQVFGQKVIKHYIGPVGGPSGNPACVYQFSSTLAAAILYPYAVPPDDAVGFAGILTDAPACNAASGYLPQSAASATGGTFYVISSGTTLADTALIGSVSDPGYKLKTLAQVAGLC